MAKEVATEVRVAATERCGGSAPMVSAVERNEEEEDDEEEDDEEVAGGFLRMTMSHTFTCRRYQCTG